jgi:DNA replication protein DnaC
MSETQSAGDIVNAISAFKSVATWTPEQWAEHTAKIEKNRKESDERERLMKISVLRQDWRAPKRHTIATVKPEGEWGRRLASITDRIGKGMLVALIGTRGTGKTQLAVEVMKAATEKMRSAIYITATEFFMEVKATYRRDSDCTEESVIRDYRNTRLLVIDEIGKRAQSDWENNLLFELINLRYNDMRDTLVIDNATKPDFIAAIGPSIASRMNECGGIIECNWGSFR